MTTNSAVPEQITTLVALFEAELPEVQFPGVDAQRLRTLADAVQDAAATLEEADRQANDARRAHAQARAALVSAAERGAGYARVFASDNEVLSARLSELTLGVAPKRKTPPKRGRKAAPKSETRDASVSELPFAGRKAKAGAA